MKPYFLLLTVILSLSLSPTLKASEYSDRPHGYLLVTSEKDGYIYHDEQQIGYTNEKIDIPFHSEGPLERMLHNL